jgi:hypothetical protein
MFGDKMKTLLLLIGILVLVAGLLLAKAWD